MPEKILFLILVTLPLISIGKSLKQEPTNDNRDDLKVRTSGPQNDKDSLTIFFDKDRVLSINELRRLYNLDDSLLPDIQFGKELDTGFLKKIRLRKNKPKSTNERDGDTNEQKFLERSEVENSDTKNVEPTNIELEARNSYTEERVDTEESTIENERTATSDTSLEEEEKSAEPDENYKDGFEFSEYSERTEVESKTINPNQEVISDFYENVKPPTRRINFPYTSTEFVERSQSTVHDILAGYQDIAPEIEKTNAFIGSGDPGILGDYLRSLNSAKLQENFRRAPPLRRSMSPHLIQTQNQLKSAEPESEADQVEAKEDSQEEQLEEKTEIKVGDAIENLNDLSPGNEYPYTPPNRANPIQALRNQIPTNLNQPTNIVTPKLRQASDHPTYPVYNRFIPNNGLGNYGRIIPYYSPYNSYITPVPLYNFRRSGQNPVCKGC